MSIILIIGATGFIGLPVATALRRAGYIVYGHARSLEKARLLAQNEILPIEGDVAKLSEWIPKTIETIIDISGLFDGFLVLLEQVKKIGAGRKPTDPKLGFIYTSGMWVHGSSTNHISEATPLEGLTSPSGIVAWRPKVEHNVLAARDVLDVAIIRPPLLYGGNGTHWSSLWLDRIYKALEQNAPTVSIVGTATSPIALVHKDDLADLFVKVVDKLTVVAASTYPIINAASHQEDLGSVLTEFSKAVGFKGKLEYRPAENAFEEGMLTGLNFRPNKARGVLQWEPRQIPFAQGMEIYAEAYKALKV
ncbi:hypothetical protein FRB96_009079 [Tulasnella sp. 330]|nr:hypothetical protein FRB96_009079 [Tulasnella sp. 330]KAG8872389.1 hypothetical protein FRB97_007700 [Tulasnella sp. 331]KAG8875715.1 hypothetical protein FRB98_007630 [Tulasnella sp. 332]